MKISKLILEFLSEKPIFSFRKKEWLCDKGIGTISGEINVNKHTLQAEIKIDDGFNGPCHINLSAYDIEECPYRLKRMRTIVEFLESYKKKYDHAVKEFIREKESNKQDGIGSH